MAVTTLTGEKIGAQKIKCNRLLQNFYKVKVKQQNTVLIHILFVSA